MKKTGINIDWLQINCTGIMVIPSIYKIVDKGISTRIFSKVIDLYSNNEHILQIAYKPYSGILRPDTHIIKIMNNQLYANDSIKFSLNIIKQLRLTVVGITRLDLCIDFQYFKNGLKPQNFIKGFMNNKYLKCGRSKYRLIGQQQNEHKFEYLRFGSNNSRSAAYLYNKTKELKEVKDKQHIRAMWEKYKFDCDIDIWRLELSFKSGSLLAVDTSTGEIEHINLETLLNDGKLTKLFNSGLNSMFRFKVNDDKQNKSRMMNLILFDGFTEESKLIITTDKKDSTRADRIFIKKMEMYNNELRQTNIDLAFLFEQHVHNFVKSRNLVAYQMKVQDELDRLVN